MLVHFGVDLVEAEWKSSVVCIGTFDGVHHGHQALIRQAVSRAREIEQPSVLVTFDRHPSAILNPSKKPPSIGTLEQNVRQFRALGVSACVILPFTRELMERSAESFLQEILVGKLRAERLVVGYDFALGHGRQGTTTWLAERIPTDIIEPVELDGHRVSSSAIRSAIQAGEIERANHLLSRNFALTGVVVSGQKLGRQLGFPTLNLARSSDQVIPRDGVYAGLCETSQGVFPAAVSVGYRPAVDGQNRTIEAYLLDYPGVEIYSETVQLFFTHRLRDEASFDTLESLRAQIESDVQKVRALAKPD